MSEERSVKIKQLLFYIVKQNIYERCVMSNKMPQKLALFGYRFSTPTLTRKIKNNQNIIIGVQNFNASGIQIHLI